MEIVHLVYCPVGYHNRDTGSPHSTEIPVEDYVSTNSNTGGQRSSRDHETVNDLTPAILALHCLSPHHVKRL